MTILSGVRRKFSTRALWGLLYLALAGISGVSAYGTPLVVTNLHQLYQLPGTEKPLECRVQLDGVVCGSKPERGLLALECSPMAAVFRHPIITNHCVPGQRVHLEGNGLIAFRNGVFQFSRVAVVENDGLQVATEKSGSIPLTAGRHPIRVEWFDGGGEKFLKLEFEGPGLPRQVVPGSALFEAKEGGQNGLHFNEYRGAWPSLPDFKNLGPARSGHATNISATLLSGTNQGGLVFEGWIEVPGNGNYTFYLTSDDGSRAYIGDGILHIKPGPFQALPQPRPFSGANPQPGWTAVEGIVTFVNQLPDRMDLELGAEEERLRVRIEDVVDLSPQFLLGSRIRVTGVCVTGDSDSGRTVPVLVNTLNAKDLLVLSPSLEEWEKHPSRPLIEVLQSSPLESSDSLVLVRGRVRSAVSGSQWLEDETGMIEVLAVPEPFPVGERIQVLGRLDRTGTNVVLKHGWHRPEPRRSDSELPLLTHPDQVRRLSVHEAARGYPVKLAGVVTARVSKGQDGIKDFVIQSGGAGIYVVSIYDFQPTVGTGFEVEGVSAAGAWAPMVLANSARCLGERRLPLPIHPTWDQINNGSLDSQYVELQGIVVAVVDDSLRLFTRGGSLKVYVEGWKSDSLKTFEKTRLRLRGCLLSAWDEHTHQIKNAEIRMLHPEIMVDQPPLADPFALPAKRFSELLQFDPRADTLQPVRVAGQVLHQRNGEAYLFDGTSGLRFVSGDNVPLAVGSLVDVVGFLDWGNPLPRILEAQVRPSGKSSMPAARVLGEDSIFSAGNDATRVQVDGLLAGYNRNLTETVLELQSGSRVIAARLKSGPDAPDSLRTGSRLQLTGTYSGRGLKYGNFESFELLLDSPGDIRVLRVPGWWTMARVLAALGIMTIVLVGVGFWAVILRRQVQSQTQVIRHTIERHATLEERTRIARELHDTLDQALAGITLQLNSLAVRMKADPEESAGILETARAMLRYSQSEARRTIRNLRALGTEAASLGAALSEMAARFNPTGNDLVQVRITGTPRRLPATVGEHLLRIAQESASNAVKHAAAPGIRVELDFLEDQLRLTIRDDGRGFDATPATWSSSGHFGLLGMRERAERIGGTLTITSAPGQGTTVQVSLPLSAGETSNE